MPDPKQTTTRVKALTAVMDNGVRHAAGDEFELERSLVAAHVAAGQIAVVADDAEKQAGTPRDKQQRGGTNK